MKGIIIINDAKFKLLIIGGVILTFSFQCINQNYNPKLPEYLKAERELRSRITPEQGLEDSILILQKRYHIDLKSEFERLKGNPDAWQKLLKELSGGK